MSVKVMKTPDYLVELLEQRYRVAFGHLLKRAGELRGEKGVLKNVAMAYKRKLNDIMGVHRRLEEQLKLKDYKDMGVAGLSNQVNFLFDSPDYLNAVSFGDNRENLYLESARFAIGVLQERPPPELFSLQGPNETEVDYYQRIGKTLSAFFVKAIGEQDTDFYAMVYWQLFAILTENFTKGTGKFDMNVLSSYQTLLSEKFVTGLRSKFKPQKKKPKSKKKPNPKQQRGGQPPKGQGQGQRPKDNQKKKPKLPFQATLDRVFKSIVFPYEVEGTSTKRNLFDFVNQFLQQALEEDYENDPDKYSEFSNNIREYGYAFFPFFYAGKVAYKREDFAKNRNLFKLDDLVGPFKNLVVNQIVSYLNDPSTVSSTNHQIPLYVDSDGNEFDVMEIYNIVSRDGVPNIQETVENAVVSGDNITGALHKGIDFGKLKELMGSEEFVYSEKTKRVSQLINNFRKAFNLNEVNLFSDPTSMTEEKFKNIRTRVLSILYDMSGRVGKIITVNLEQFAERFNIDLSLDDPSTSNRITPEMGYQRLSKENKEKADEILEAIKTMEAENDPENKLFIQEMKEKLNEYLVKQGSVSKPKPKPSPGKKADYKNRERPPPGPPQGPPPIQEPEGEFENEEEEEDENEDEEEEDI